MFDDDGVGGVVNSREGAAAQVKNGVSSSVGNVVAASGCGTHGHSRHGPEVHSQVVALDRLLHHVVHGIGCGSADAVSYHVVVLALESSTRCVSEEADDLVLAGRSPDYRRESKDV